MKEREAPAFLRALLLEATGKKWYSLGLSNLTASDATASSTKYTVELAKPLYESTSI